MDFVFVVLVFVLTTASGANECKKNAKDDLAYDEDIMTNDDTMTPLSPESVEIQELLKTGYNETMHNLISILSKQATASQTPFKVQDKAKKSYACSKLECPPVDKMTPVCACNFITGNVVSFKNKCDLEKHNCRFDTNFKVILNEICPWEFAFRRSDKELVFDYRDAKYYN